MRIACVKCGKPFESLIINQELAWKEIYGLALKHIMRQHNDVAAKLQGDVARLMVAASVYMTVSEALLVPEDEKFIAAHMEELQEVLMSAAGFDAEDIPDEEELEEDEPNEEVEEIEELEDDKKQEPEEWPVARTVEDVPVDS